MIRPALLGGLLLIALAPVGAAQPIEDPCQKIGMTTIFGDCMDLVQPGFGCWMPAIWPPTTAECQVGPALLDCDVHDGMVAGHQVVSGLDCWAREGNSSIGLWCAAFTDANGWRGFDCQVTGVNCTQALWGVHTQDVIVGGYNGCNVVVASRLA